MVFPRCFLFQGNCENSQVHLKTEQKIFCRTEKVLPITSTSEALRDKNDSTFFVTKDKFDARNPRYQVIPYRKCSPHTWESPKLKEAAQSSICGVYFGFSRFFKDIQLPSYPETDKLLQTNAQNVLNCALPSYICENTSYL